MTTARKWLRRGAVIGLIEWVAVAAWWWQDPDRVTLAALHIASWVGAA